MNLTVYILFIDLLCSFLWFGGKYICFVSFFEKSVNLMLIILDEKRESLSKRQMEQ